MLESQSQMFKPMKQSGFMARVNRMWDYILWAYGKCKRLLWWSSLTVIFMVVPISFAYYSEMNNEMMKLIESGQSTKLISEDAGHVTINQLINTLQYLILPIRDTCYCEIELFMEHISVDLQGRCLLTPQVSLLKHQVHLFQALQTHSLSLTRSAIQCDQLAQHRQYQQADKCYEKIRLKQRELRQKKQITLQAMQKILKKNVAGLARCGKELVQRDLHECEESILKQSNRKLKVLLEQL